MAICIECEEEFSDKRKALGYDTCLDCGAEHAREQAVAKSKRIAPHFNKGPYQYISEGDDVKTLGRKV